MSIERELKFRLGPRAASRAVGALGLGEARAVRSIYFDTAEHTLQRARMALRLRRHGGRWLQALKGEISPAARHEWEMPVARPALELERFPRGEILAASGIDVLKLELRPAFETRFARRSCDVRVDDALLEIALDRGRLLARGAREPICELEIELKSGAPWSALRYADTLIEPLGLQLALESKAERGYRLAEGVALAPPRKWRRCAVAERTPGEALAALTAAALEQVCRNAPGVLESDDAEYLHQLRVGLRRFRTTLGAFKALSPVADALKEALRVLTPALGAARDWDVFVEGLSPRSRLGREARRRRARASRQARRALRSAAFNHFLVRAFAWIEEAPWQPLAAPLAPFAASALDRLHRKLTNPAQGIDWRDADQRHAVRIRVKRLRYACDAFADLFSGGELRRYLERLERLQDGFGELNDIATARRLLGELGATSRSGALEARERRLIAALPRAWSRFASQPRFWKADK